MGMLSTVTEPKSTALQLSTPFHGLYTRTSVNTSIEQKYPSVKTRGWAVVGPPKTGQPVSRSVFRAKMILSRNAQLIPRSF